MKAGEYAPAYYFAGEEEYRKGAALRALCDKAVDPAMRDFNLETRRAADLDAETLGSLLETPPMMAERRVLVVRDVGDLKKDARAMLEKYLQRPASDMLLVLTDPAGATVDQELADATSLVLFRAMDGVQLPKWIAKQAEVLHHTTITEGAVSLLISAVGNDSAQLIVELEKLANYAGERAIDEDAVTAIVGVRREETIPEFLDLVARRDAAAALTRLPGLLQQPRMSGVYVAMQLTTHFMALAYARALRDEGWPPARISGEMFQFLKEASTNVGRPWGEAVKAWLQVVDRWSTPALAKCLDALLQADASLKNSRVSSELQTLTTLVLTLCAGRA